MCLPDPTKPPTPSEFTVIAVVVVISLIAFGVAAVVISFRAPPEKHEMAIALEHLGFWSLGLGVGVAGVFWFYRKIVD